MPKFIGFDGNNEGELMGIATFTVQDMKRFSDFKGRDLNSHSPMATRYGRMAKALELMHKTLMHRSLCVKQIIELLDAANA